MIFIDPHTDFLNTLDFINDFTKSLGIIDVCVDLAKIDSLIKGAVHDGLYPKGRAATASPFRKIASFVTYSVADMLIPEAFPEERICSELYKIKNHQNAILGLEIAIDSLHGATIHLSDADLVLKERIKLSKHSYVDVIEALSHVTPLYGAQMVAVLLEQMAYRQNPDCEYK